jgi:hypothetical protein
MIVHKRNWQQMWGQIRFLLLMLFGFLFVVFLVLLFMGDAKAASCGRWETYARTRCDPLADFPHISCRRHYHRRCAYWVHGEPELDRYPRPNERQYRSLELRQDLRKERERCRWSQHMRATGDDKLDEKSAQTSAQDRWAIMVETRLGSLYADIDNAADLRVACVKKVPTTGTQKGQASLLGIRHHVCEIEAVPCAPGREETDPTRRRMEKIVPTRDRDGDTP